MEVLLQYLNSKKVREVTDNADIHKIVQETFSLEEQTYMLQKFDQDFEDYIDWEDLTLNDKDKFRVVDKIVQNSNLLIPSLSLTLDSCAAEEIAEASEVQDVVTLPLRLHQWPHKVVLPFGNFSSSLKEDLAAGKWLNWDRSRELVGHLANYAYTFKPYPNKAERLQICQALVDEYPHLKNDIGVGIGGWELKLQNKLKKLRQVDTSLEVFINKINSKVPGSKVPKNIAINPKRGELNWAPEHVPGETAYSVGLHKQELREEASKSEHQQDKGKIAALMSLTYSFRRDDINNKILVRDLMETYPIFFQDDEQFEEFQRLTAISIREKFVEETESQGKILYKLFLNKKKTVKELELLEIFNEEYADLDALQKKEAEISLGFYTIPYLLKDDIECIIKIVPDGDNTPDYGSFAEAFPKIYGNGTLRKGSYIIICEDVELNRSEDFLTALCLLVSFYYTMNIQFPERAINTFKFLQFSVLGMQTGRLPPKVKTLMSKISRS